MIKMFKKKVKKIISIVMPAYNTEGYIEEAINSVLKQTYKNIELIIVNDGSKDNTLEKVKRFKDPRLVVIDLPKNKGLGNALNVGFSRASGDYITIMDSDDRYSDKRVLARLSKEIRLNSDLIRGRMRLWTFVDDNESLSFHESESLIESDKTVTLESYLPLIHHVSSNQFLIKKEFFDKYKFSFRFEKFEDAPFLSEMLLNAESVRLTNVTMYDYRRRLDNSSITSSPLKLSDIDIYSKHVDFMLELFSSASKELEILNIDRYLNRCIFAMFYRIQTGSDREVLEKFVSSIATVFEKHGLNNKLIEQKNCNEFCHQDIFQNYKLFLFLLENGEVESICNVNFREKITPSVMDCVVSNLNDRSLAVGMYNILSEYMDEFKPIDGISNKQVYLHMGSTKTGSTALQNFFSLNRDVLLSKGVYYPDFGIFKEDGRDVRTAGHRGVISEPYDFLIKVSLESSSYDKVLISCETLSALLKSNPGRWHYICHLLSLSSIFPIICLREQAQWVDSMYKEFVCGTHRRYIKGISSFLEEQNVLELNYLSLIKTLSTSESVSDVKVIPYTRKLKGNNLFFAVINIVVGEYVEDEWNEIPYEQTNPSIPGGLIDVIKALNSSALNDEEYKTSFRKFYNNYFYKSDLSVYRCSVLNEDEILAIRNAYRESWTAVLQSESESELYESLKPKGEIKEIPYDVITSLINSLKISD
ncbi:glycosyltransferase family 2 protein [Vibrio sp. TRT 1302]|uniref:glycosyltransferase family 2 protein n=1 Tax=Vibrio sp. TRT 1302 TaxID=3418504 RepID=UPI003CEC5B28